MPIGSQTRGAAVRPTASMVSGRHPSNSWRIACRRATSSAGAGRVWPREVVRPGGVPHRDGQPADVVLPTVMWADRTGACTNADWTGHPQGRPPPTAAPGAQPGMPAPGHHRPERQSLSQPGHDPPSQAADRRRPRHLVELSEADAAGLEVAEGNLLQATFPRGHLHAMAPISGILPGCSPRSPTALGTSWRATTPDGWRRPSTSSPSPSRARSPSGRPTGRPDYRFSWWSEGYRP